MLVACDGDDDVASIRFYCLWVHYW